MTGQSGIRVKGALPDACPQKNAGRKKDEPSIHRQLVFGVLVHQAGYQNVGLAVDFRFEGMT
ncbi:hypothetical protein [Pandoraea pulmonicola]|uniref:Uncharacterized protein n=1 Tax=Pandoraea pulmonicola TaxID=93221 RepID=A0AAJ5CZS5_PANPU|nr:hypothetical protein [Pandoraea pulmonicola]SUA90036.1 Uncharacterised protein [Pandoraea pulmonicola]